MRITKISVKGLFGMFDHEIPLNQESRITIVHGPNGVGKTVLMQFVHGLIDRGGELFGTAPFEHFQIEFADGNAVTVDKSAVSRKLIIQYTDNENSEFIPYAVDLPEHDELEGYPDDWDSLILSSGAPQWFWHLRKEAESSLIHTLRLQSNLFDEYGRPIVIADLGEDFVEPTVVDLPIRFFNDISAHTSFDSELELWDVFKESVETEARMLNYDIDLPNLHEELAESWISQRREQLQALKQSILEMGEEHETWFPEVMLFMSLIDERCLFKSLKFRDNMFVFVADNGSEVPISALSSGEQHLVNLYYQLLFEIEPDTLVMIDEPELSMNVVWQRNFLKDLQRIIELRKFDVLIATHSPMIIHDKWDWMVPMGETMDD